MEIDAFINSLDIVSLHTPKFDYRGGVIRYREGVSIRYRERASIRYRASRIFRKRGGYTVQLNFFGNFFRFFWSV